MLWNASSPTEFSGYCSLVGLPGFIAGDQCRGPERTLFLQLCTHTWLGPEVQPALRCLAKWILSEGITGGNSDELARERQRIICSIRLKSQLSIGLIVIGVAIWPPRMISSALCNLSLWALCLWWQSYTSKPKILQHGFAFGRNKNDCRRIASVGVKPLLCRRLWHVILILLFCRFCSLLAAALCEVTAFLGDGIIFILFMVQRKSVVRRTEWTEARKARQRCCWSFRTTVRWKGRPNMFRTSEKSNHIESVESVDFVTCWRLL